MKKGFTLIELLAVIVILAIIALIATPIILGIVEDARRDAFLRSVELVVSTTDIDIFNKTYTDSYTYTLEDGNIPNLEIGIKNTDNMNGSIIYDIKGNEEYAIHNGKYCVRKYKGISKAEIKNYKEGMCVIPTNINNVLTNISFEHQPVTYDGTIKEVIVNGVPEGLEVTYPNGNTFKDAGTYTVKAIIHGNEVYNGNYELETIFTINKAPIKIIADNKFSKPLEPIASLTYKVEGTVYGNDDLKIEINKKGDNTTGNHAIEIKINNDNYDPEIINGIYSIGYNDGQIVYFDVENGIGCTKEDYEESLDETDNDFRNSYTEYNGLNGTNGQNGCLLFYSFDDNGEDNVKLLLDHNLTNNTTNTSVVWQWTGEGVELNRGPENALESLSALTNEWKGTEIPENYTVSQTTGGNYTIPYKTEGYKARLITMDEVSRILGIENFDENTAENATYSITELLPDSFGWICDRLNPNALQMGCNNASNSSAWSYGYWTATSVFNLTTNAWEFYMLNFQTQYAGNKRDIRPVIEVNRDKITTGETPSKN